MIQMNCQLESMQDKSTPLNVGDLQVLTCDGVLSAPLKNNVQFVFKDENEKYKLHVLSVKESSVNQFKLVVTGYRPGEHREQVLTLSDGEQTITTNGLSWTVSSVIEPGTQPQLVSSKGPFNLSYPIWLWIALALSILAVVLSGLFVYNLRLRRKKILSELLQYRTALSAFAQFSKEIRQIQKMVSAAQSNQQTAPNLMSVVDKIENAFRLYLIREWVVPALQVSDRELMKALKKADGKFDSQYGGAVRKLLSEFQKARDDSQKITLKDVEGLLFLTRQSVEKFMNHRKKK